MNESSSMESNSAFPGRQPALVLGVALLIALGVVLVCVLRDNARRTTLETITEVSSIGDTHYVSVTEPAEGAPNPVVAHLNGQPLYPAGYKRHTKIEADMQAVAKDEATGLTVYQAPVKAKDAGEPPTYFLKLGPGEFLKVRP